MRAAPPRRLAAPLGAEATSDATGAFELRGLSAGTVQVVARHGAYADGAVEVEVEPAGPPADVRVVLTRGGRIQGRARHRNGSPVLGVVAVHPVEAAAVTGLPPARVPIAADGSFVLDHVPAGRARVVLFSAEPVRPAAAPNREVEVRDGAAASVSFELREVLVGGRITRGGAPAPHLRIGPHRRDAVRTRRAHRRRRCRG